MGPGISLQTCGAACAPFTPNNSEQRSGLTCYRGCWHVISRPLFMGYRRRGGVSSPASSSPVKALYNLPASIAHAASLRQAFAHCGIFLAAASRRSLGRISVPMRPFALSGRIPVVALVGFCSANKLMGRGPLPRRGRSPFDASPPREACHGVLPRVSTGCPPPEGASPTRSSPVRRSHGEQAPQSRSTCMLKTRRQRSF